MKIKREFKVGVISALVLVVFIWGFSFIKGSNWFTPNYHYFAIYHNSGGIEAGRAVKINGVPVGKVSNVYFPQKDLNSIVVRFEVDKKYRFTRNSLAEISSGASLMSDTELNLIVIAGGMLAESGDTLKGVISGGFTDAIKNTIDPIKGQLIATLNTVDSVLKNLNSVLTDKNKANLENTLSDLSLTMRNASSLTASLDDLAKTNKSNLNTTFSNLAQSSEKLNTILDTLSAEKLASTFDNLNKSVSDLSQILDKVNNGDGTLSKLISDPHMYQNLVQASSSLDELLKDLKANPKRYVNITVFGKKEKNEKVDKSK